MKLGEDVLLEIIDIVRQGLIEGKDVSEMLRDIDLECPSADLHGVVADDKIFLSESYKKSKGRV